MFINCVLFSKLKRLQWVGWTNKFENGAVKKWESYVGSLILV